MVKNIPLALFFAFLITFNINAQQIGEGFTSITNLTPEPTSINTGEKPQSKAWKHNGKWWAVFPNSSGTHIWRLDNTEWTQVLTISSKTNSKADCKLTGKTTHILLHQGSTSQLVSVEHDEVTNTYKPWVNRTATIDIPLESAVETATIDVDSNGRMWLAYVGAKTVKVKWSDSPYNAWSAPITVASNLTSDDICAVIAMPGKVGVFWSDQTTKRFGFKTHTDGADPSVWSSNEVPASQSALNVGSGMADDHMNMAVAKDGTLYCAIKTEYDNSDYPQVALLVRRPSGQWDDLYEVSKRGTRPIVILNEEQGRLKVIYTEGNSGGKIYYHESSTANISFGKQLTLIDGYANNSTSTKDNYSSDVLVLASNNSQVLGVLAIDGQPNFLPAAPLLASPKDKATNIQLTTTLTWEAVATADSYQAQVSTTSDFVTTVFDRSNISATSTNVGGLTENQTYYWRARATNSAGTGSWSETWTFTTGASNTLPSGSLVAHYKMDEGDGNTLVDASTYNNVSSIMGNPTWVSGPSGLALQLNGKDQYALTADHASLDITGQITLSTWIRANERANQYLIHKATVNSVDGYELSLTSAGLILFRFNQATNGEALRVNSETLYPADGATWIHVAATYDGTSARLYINGVENRIKTFSNPPAIKANNLPLAIGAQHDGFRSFNGAMDDARVYNRALSAEEIYALANGQPVAKEPEVPKAPMLASPENNAIGVGLNTTLTWGGVTAADSYHVQVSTSSDFTTTILDKTGVTTTSQNLSGLTESTTYFWRVSATNTAGTSSWSETWTFTTGTTTTPTGSLVAHFKMDEGSGNTLVDASSYGNNAAINGNPTWVTGKSGLGLQLDGKSQYATANDNSSLDISGNITLAAWIKADTRAHQYLIHKATNNSVDGYELSLTKAGLILFRFNQATYGEALRVNSETLYPADGQTWIHVAATFDGSIARLYVNGVENRTKTLDGAPPININNLPLAIGAQHDGNRTFSGAMDDVRVYNRALSAEEILELASTQSTGSLSASSNEGMNSTNENNIVAYPNPFAGDLKVNFTLAEKGAYKVSLYNSKGDLIEEIKKGESEAHVTNSVEFDGSTLPKGLYLMKLETSKGIKTYKLLK